MDRLSPPASCWVTVPWLVGVSWSILRGWGSDQPSRPWYRAQCWPCVDTETAHVEPGAGAKSWGWRRELWGRGVGSRWGGVSPAVLCPEMSAGFVCRPHPFALSLPQCRLVLAGQWPRCGCNHAPLLGCSAPIGSPTAFGHTAGVRATAGPQPTGCSPLPWPWRRCPVCEGLRSAGSSGRAAAGAGQHDRHELIGFSISAGRRLFSGTPTRRGSACSRTIDRCSVCCISPSTWAGRSPQHHCPHWGCCRSSHLAVAQSGATSSAGEPAPLPLSQRNTLLQERAGISGNLFAW